MHSFRFLRFSQFLIPIEIIKTILTRLKNKMGQQCLLIDTFGIYLAVCSWDRKYIYYNRSQGDF